MQNGYAVIIVIFLLAGIFHLLNLKEDLEKSKQEAVEKSFLEGVNYAVDTFTSLNNLQIMTGTNLSWEAKCYVVQETAKTRSVENSKNNKK